MKIVKYINIEQEVELHLSPEDICLILKEAGSPRDVLVGLNTISTYLEGIPNSLISQLKTEQKVIITDLFLKQAKRFKEV